ncbi:MAG: C40 family peptidase [Thermoleophilia bacterium]|nr:C40 family peptidase [Thermoleophilia bacterium]
MTVSARMTRVRGVLLAGALVLTMLVTGSLPVAAHRELPGPTVREQKIEKVIRIAKKQIGDPWVWGRTGPSSFDCIGLVYFAFKKAHALRLIGGRYRTIAALRQWAENHTGESRRFAKRGDLVVWGGTKHIGIYLGNGKAISALVSGVQIHKISRLYDPFTTFVHARRAW